MAARDPLIASLNASYARNVALSRQSPEQRRAHVQPALDGQLRRLEDEVDPDRRLDPADRAARVESLRRAKMAELAKVGLAARRAKRAARVGAA